MKRWSNFLKNSDFESRIRLLALIAFPLWVLSLPVCRFAISPWVAGLIAPYFLMRLFDRYPRLPLFLIAGAMISCKILFMLDLSGSQSTLVCCWAWFCLGFGGGFQWWSLSED